MTNATATGLRKLRATDLASINYKADVRGQKVIDADGRYIGQVDALFIDEPEKMVRFLRVSPGWSHEGGGNGNAEEFLIPVDAVARVRSGAVQVGRSREELAAAALDDAQLGDPAVVESLYIYYGYKPFWAEGYAYPPYPYYV